MCFDSNECVIGLKNKDGSWSALLRSSSLTKSDVEANRNQCGAEFIEWLPGKLRDDEVILMNPVPTSANSVSFALNFPSFKDMCQAYVQSGNALAFIRYGSNIYHFVVCVGIDSKGAVTVVHRIPKENSPDDPSQQRTSSCCSQIKENKQGAFDGIVKREQLDNVADIRSLNELHIFKCHSKMPAEHCRAIASHKALTRLSEPEYNAVLKSCEDFARECCTRYSDRWLSIQADNFFGTVLPLLTACLSFPVLRLSSLRTLDSLLLSTASYFAVRYGIFRVYSFAERQWIRQRTLDFVAKCEEPITIVFIKTDDGTVRCSLDYDQLKEHIISCRKYWYFVGQFRARGCEDEVVEKYLLKFDEATENYLLAKTMFISPHIDYIMEEIKSGTLANNYSFLEPLAEIALDLKVVALSYERRKERFMEKLQEIVENLMLAHMLCSYRLCDDEFLALLLSVAKYPLTNYLEHLSNVFKEFSSLRLECSVKSLAVVLHLSTKIKAEVLRNSVIDAKLVKDYYVKANTCDTNFKDNPVKDVETILSLFHPYTISSIERWNDESMRKVSVSIGLRVVRGPFWNWENDDQGSDITGFLVCVEKDTCNVKVVWDDGSSASYEAGTVDLRTFDNAVVGVRHSTVTCGECGEEGIWGFRWQCMICTDFDLCSKCYMEDAHDLTHSFFRIDRPNAIPSKVAPREGAKKVKTVGIFPGATVRKRNSAMPDDDGVRGVVIGMCGWNEHTARNSVMVSWTDSSFTQHSVGYNGIMDVTYVAPPAETTSTHYLQHLPHLLGTKASQLVLN